MAVVEIYRHLSAEEAEKIALEIYNRYKAEVDKKWEQFRKEMEGVPPEILYDQELWEDWMMDRWIQLVDEIDYPKSTGRRASAFSSSMRPTLGSRSSPALSVLSWWMATLILSGVALEAGSITRTGTVRAELTC